MNECGSSLGPAAPLVDAQVVRSKRHTLKGEVALADPVAKYLPRQVEVPRRNDRSISLLDLATHTSGLRAGSRRRKR